MSAAFDDLAMKAQGLPTESEFHNFEEHYKKHASEFANMPGGNGKKPDKKGFWKMAKKFLKKTGKSIKVKDNPDIQKWPNTKIKFNYSTLEYMAYNPKTGKIITYFLPKHSVFNGANMSYWIKKAIEYWEKSK